MGAPPRAYVLRCFHLHNRRMERGETFFVDLHMFDLGATLEHREVLVRALERMGSGLDNRATLESVRTLDSAGREHGAWKPISFDLPNPNSDLDLKSSIVLEYLSPTELIEQGRIASGLPFETLVRRLRDRLSALSTFYGDGPLEIDFRIFPEAAKRVRPVQQRLTWIAGERTSSRANLRHAISGWVGRVSYEGPVEGYLAWLEAGQWAGVGEQVVFGKGAYRVLGVE